MDYVQECLQLQSTINQSLGKSVESLLASSMTMSSNLLLNRRDNYLKHCSKDVTEDDISRLRNASFTPNEVFSVETLSEKFQSVGSCEQGLLQTQEGALCQTRRQEGQQISEQVFLSLP